MTVKIGRPAHRAPAASALWLLMAGAAAAQPAPRPPAELVSCLCLQQSLAHQNETITSQRQAFDQRRQELAQLNAEVEQQRPQVNVNDAAAVSAFRQLLERRDAAQQAVDADPGTDLAAAISSYNERADSYNRDCTQHDFDAAAIAAMKKTLTCPAE